VTRFEGEHAVRQLAELYRALRLYVNCFQPSMKLQAKHYEGRKVRRVYDAAKTPLQRLLLSGVLPTSTQEELHAVVKALDPIRLFQHLQQLQQAVFLCAVNDPPVNQKTPDASLLRFVLEGCRTEENLSGGMERDEEAVPENPCQESQESRHVLDWRRTRKDPFAGQWEQILSWMQADPTLSSGDLFRQLQSLSPGRYQPMQIRTFE
jgi:hypothetical protein